MRGTALALLLLLGCKKPQPPAAETVPAPVPGGVPAPASTDPDERPPPDLAALQGLARRLSVRDPEPDCSALEAELEVDPVASFQYVIETVERPPWAPMRAAGCLIEGHAAELAPTLASWVRSDETQGLGRLVLTKLPELPDEVAVGVVKAGLSGPLAEVAAEAAAKDARESVRALVPAE